MPYAYEGYYARFESSTKKNAAILMGADTLVGDEFDFAFKTEGTSTVAWVSNKFGTEIGFMDAATSRKLQLANARGLDIHIILLYIAYSEEPSPGVYWGEMAIICFDPTRREVLEPFVKQISAKMKEGVRPTIDLTEAELAKMTSEPGWFPSSSTPITAPAGSAIVKSNLSFTERMVEQGRAGNKGCYVGSIAFLVLLVVGLFFLLKGCIGL